MKPMRINWRSKWYTWLFVPTKTEEKFEDFVLLLLFNYSDFLSTTTLKIFIRRDYPR